MKLLAIRKLLTVTLLSFSGFLELAVHHDTYSLTGHDEFSEIRFFDDGVILLKDLTNQSLEQYYRKCKWKMFGWSTYYLYEYEDCEYVSKVIFSRSNKTSMPYTFSYSLQEVTYTESSYSVKGSINVKESAKIKKVELSSQQEFSAQFNGEYYVKTTESGSLDVTVNPGKKMTLRVTGDAKLSTCFGKYYFLGICMRKGAFECIDIMGSFFELVEEDA